MRGLFGGNIHQAVTGAAPIAPEILEFFYACGMPVLEGWGMTETTAVGTVCTLDHFKFGTVGRPCRAWRSGSPRRTGRSWSAGPTSSASTGATPRRPRRPWSTAGCTPATSARVDEEGYLSITGRKKDIIITAGGKNLTPSNIENDLKQSRYISQAVMHGDRRPFPVALITLDAEEILPWAGEHGLPEDLGALADADEVRALVQDELDRANAHYAQVEQIKKFAILDRDLTIEDGELTPTLKVKRSVINERFADLFESLYAR